MGRDQHGSPMPVYASTPATSNVSLVRTGACEILPYACKRKRLLTIECLVA